MTYTYTPMPPILLKSRRINLMRVSFILLLVGTSLSIFYSLIYSIYSINMSLGYIDFQDYYLVMSLSNAVSLITSIIMFTGEVMLLIVLVKLAQNGEPKLNKNCKTTFILLILRISLSFLFSLFYSSFIMVNYIYGFDIDIIIRLGSLFPIAMNSAIYIFLGLTIRQLKTEHRIDNKPVITSFVYPIMFLLRILTMFDIFLSELTSLIVTMIINLLGLVIVVVFFSEALVSLNRIKNAIKSDLVIQELVPSVPPKSIVQYEIPPSRKADKFCIKCGSALPVIARFCGNCGHSVN